MRAELTGKLLTSSTDGLVILKRPRRMAYSPATKYSWPCFIAPARYGWLNHTRRTLAVSSEAIASVICMPRRTYSPVTELILALMVTGPGRRFLADVMFEKSS